MDIGSPGTPRWVQRFANFDRALVLLRTAIELIDDQADALAPEVRAVIEEGTVQRFEYSFELAWKTLKDYLQWRKVTLPKLGPGDVIKAAFAAGYLAHGQDWMDALDARNKMAHVYRREAFERVLGDIRERFLARLEELHDMLIDERLALETGAASHADGA